MCEHGRQRYWCKECARSPSRDQGRKRAASTSAQSHGAASNANAGEGGYETATYADEDVPTYVRPRKRRAVVKEEERESEDVGYETAAYANEDAG